MSFIFRIFVLVKTTNMTKKLVKVGEYVQGNICNQRGDTIKTFNGYVVGFTKTSRVRIKDSNGHIRNFHIDETHHLGENLLCMHLNTKANSTITSGNICEDCGEEI